MKKIIALILSIILIPTIFCGCGKKQPSITTVIGVANNANATLASTQLLEKVIADACSTNGSSVSVAELDGDAYEVFSLDIQYPSGYTKDNIKRIFQTNCLEVSNAIGESLPRTPEVDLMQGFHFLSNSFKALTYGDKNAKLNLIIVSNLLSTKGKINLCEASLYFDTDKYVKYLQNDLPDFHGVGTVKWIITDCIGTQEKLEHSDMEHLEEFYATLLCKAGANRVEFIPANATTDEIDRSDWCTVSSVDVRHTSFKSVAQANKVDITLDSNTLFKSDSTEFANESQAKKTLKNLVPIINSYDEKVFIVGSTATTSSSAEQHIKFAKQRSDKVVKLLVKLGCKPEKLQALSVGKEPHSWRTPDSLAGNASNRCVYIVSQNTQKVSEFLKIASQYAAISGAY